jgi:hypothetical protein
MSCILLLDEYFMQQSFLMSILCNILFLNMSSISLYNKAHETYRLLLSFVEAVYWDKIQLQC